MGCVLGHTYYIIYIRRVYALYYIINIVGLFRRNQLKIVFISFWWKREIF